jgi:hypothetical protein
MLTTVDTEKECRVCHEYYPLTAFAERHHGKNDRVNICNRCRQIQQHEHEVEKREAMTISGDRSKSYVPADPWADLACAILKQAVLDYNAKRGSGPRAFFVSDWCDEVCALAGYDSEWIRERIGIG